MKNLLRTSAIKLAKMIRLKEVSSEEVVHTYIEQAKKVNPLINAIVRDRYELAILEAKEVDQKLKADPDLKEELLGVPFTVKEHFCVKGLPQTAGLVSKRHNIATGDSTVVARMKAAGAIPIGVTNLSILMRGWVTDNKIYGKTYNPYNLDYNPGGSSGGEAAIIAAAGSPIGLGSDAGGSIRMPAFFCGIFGHKPSPSIVPLTGAFPHFPNVDTKLLKADPKLLSFYAVAGPMAKHSEDLMPVLKIISGPDNQDLYVNKIDFGTVDEKLIPKLKYYYIDHKNIHEDVKRAQDKAIQTLISTGAEVMQIPLGLFEYALEVFLQSNRKIGHSDDLKVRLGDRKAFYIKTELELEKVGKSDYSEYFLRLIKEILSSPPKTDRNYLKIGQDLREEMNALLGDNGVLIYPTHPYPAIKHEDGIRYFDRVAFTGIFNSLGYPATAFPMGFSKEGLPVGIQAVATQNNDHLTISVAKFMESQGFGWVPPDLAE